MTVERTPKKAPAVVVVPEATNDAVEVVAVPMGTKVAQAEVVQTEVAVEPRTVSEWFDNLEASLSNTIEPFIVELEADMDNMGKYGSFSINKDKLLTAVGEIVTRQLENIKQRLS